MCTLSTETDDPIREEQEQARLLSGAGMQKMWKQLGSESWGLSKPQGDKGFSPRECRSKWEALIAVVDSEEVEKENACLTVIPFQETGRLHNPDAQ